jgi:hypothetical protein
VDPKTVLDAAEKILDSTGTRTASPRPSIPYPVSIPTAGQNLNHTAMPLLPCSTITERLKAIRQYFPIYENIFSTTRQEFRRL